MLKTKKHTYQIFVAYLINSKKGLFSPFFVLRLYIMSKIKYFSYFLSVFIVKLKYEKFNEFNN